MRPFDPRLVGRIGPARRYVITTAALGAVTALLILAQALLLARLLSPILAPAPLAEDGLGWWGRLVPEGTRSLATGLAWLIAVVAARAAVTWLQERLAHRAGVRVISDIRTQVVDHAATLGPRWVASGGGASVTTVVTRGLENLLPYFVRYLPQLMLAATVTPLMLIVVLGLDWLSAVIIAVTLPLVPVFMILVGLLTRERSARHLASMDRLATRTLDLIEGLPTLRALGRERGPAARVRELGDAYRAATMSSLRIAFLSGMVLELLTTLAVALVAVTMGFRLVAGDIGIETALAVLVLAPEVYLPVRNVGTHFHASADGLAAADAAFSILDERPPGTQTESLGAAPPLRSTSLHVRGLAVATPDGRRWAPSSLSFDAVPGTVTVLRGSNGEGKSTALMALVGLLAPDSGTIHAVATGTDSRLLADATATVQRATWSAQCGWVPQRPDLGPDGRTLSLGQRQRRALERAFASNRPVLVLDEPTAHLDSASRAEVIDQIRAAAHSGATVVIATHEEEMIVAADVVVDVLDAPRVSETHRHGSTTEHSAGDAR
ncbi:ABC transporter ATP-binding protein/permease [Demequina aurantiaca]|uniref:ABC transporter ATP-binding protein/permease n=1 Tax=Demequina aurantiaca TaxID=676200 RepID=UPI000A031FFA|nr:ABC transporter transmembrane domain-containing protein [Demequina aurantiaca]